MGEIAKQGVKGTVVTYAGVFVGFLTTFFVLTRFLSAEEIGLARVLIDAATLFMGLAGLGTSSSIIRFYPYFRQGRQDHGFFLLSLIVPLFGFLLFTLIYCAAAEPIQGLFEEKSPLMLTYYYFVLPLAFFMLYQTVMETNANVRLQIVFPRAVRELITRVLMLCVYLLYAFRYLTLDGFVWAICAVYAIAALLDTIYVFTLGDVSLKPDVQFLKQNPQLVRKYLRYTAFLLLSAIATVLAPSLSSFFLTAQLGLNYAGIFAIATYISVMVSIPYRSLNAIASPQLAAAIKEENKQQISVLTKQVSNTLWLVGCFILLCIWVNIDLIFYILPNGAEYATARYAVLLLCCSQLLLATFNISLTTLNYSRHYYYSLLYSLLLTVSAILLNNYLIPRIEMTGAALANLLSYALYFVLILLTVRVTTGTSPLSLNQAKTALLAVLVLIVNYILDKYLSISSVWAIAVLKSAVLLLPFAVIAYYLQLSPEINLFLRNKLSRA